MSSTSYDVIVVGAGNAALCAALSARENGARVLVLESAPREQRGGNSAYTGGGFRIVYHGLDDIRYFVPDLSREEIASTDFSEYSADQFFDDLANVTEYRIDPDLAEILVRKSTETLKWVKDKGVRFVPNYGTHAFKHEGRFKFVSPVIKAIGGGRGLVDFEFAAAEEHGIEIRYHTRATSLLVGDAGVEGVRVAKGNREEEIRSRAVVLACGGFEANRTWRTRYLGPGWDLAKVRGTRYNTGDGISMALKIGALPYGHWSGAHATEWDLNAPEFGDYEVGDGFGKHCYTFGIMLNANGVRFLDEGADTRNHTYAKYGRNILQQPGQFCWQLFDSKTIPLLRPSYRIKKVTKETGNTLEEIVGKLTGVKKEHALRTIHEYNAAVMRDVPFNPNLKDGKGTRGLAIPKSNWAQAIDTAPFEAYAVTCGITFTFGGLKITPEAQVVDREEAPIPGLYAAGELVGGIFYFNYPGGSGLTAGSVFGCIAGKNAARRGARR